MADKQTDKQLIERVQNGEKAAYDLLVLKYQQRVIKLVSRFVRNQSDAQENYQDEISHFNKGKRNREQGNEKRNCTSSAGNAAGCTRQLGRIH